MAGFIATAQDASVNVGFFIGITTSNAVIRLVAGSGTASAAGGTGSVASAKLTRAELFTWFGYPYDARYRFTVASIREALAGHSVSWWPWWLQ